MHKFFLGIALLFAPGFLYADTYNFYFPPKGSLAHPIKKPIGDQPVTAELSAREVTLNNPESSSEKKWTLTAAYLNMWDVPYMDYPKRRVDRYGGLFSIDYRFLKVLGARGYAALFSKKVNVNDEIDEGKLAGLDLEYTPLQLQPFSFARFELGFVAGVVKLFGVGSEHKLSFNGGLRLNVDLFRSFVVTSALRYTGDITTLEAGVGVRL